MSKEDIERAVKDAERFAEEDKKQKEAVEVKNHAESMIFQIEKSMEEAGDKFSESDKTGVKAAIEKLRETVKSGTPEAIKADTEALEKAFYPLAEKLYAEAQQQANGAAGANVSGDGTVYTDFEDKTDK
jgi:molecular chaperone DnaK